MMQPSGKKQIRGGHERDCLDRHKTSSSRSPCSTFLATLIIYTHHNFSIQIELAQLIFHPRIVSSSFGSAAFLVSTYVDHPFECRADDGSVRSINSPCHLCRNLPIQVSLSDTEIRTSFPRCIQNDLAHPPIATVQVYPPSTGTPRHLAGFLESPCGEDDRRAGYCKPE